MFGEKIKELRIRNNMTQVEFAKKFQIATGTIAMWETNKRQPDIEMLNKIANYFSVSLDYLVGDNKRIVLQNQNIQDLDIRRIERARDKMPLEAKERMMKVLENSFVDYFSNDFKDEDIDE